MTTKLHEARPARERVLLTGLILPEFELSPTIEADAALSEARGLAEAAEAEVVGEGIIQRRQKPTPATLFGRGKVEEIREAVIAHGADAVVVDNDLSPAQGRNLEKVLKVRVIDRSELILDIFARRANTRQARLQVELAQNEYMAPRLMRLWTHLERTEGAIGTRGPGETQLETDRRLLRKRIGDLKAELREIEARKQREVGTRTDQFTVGLIGYTNAGKSTLMNRLTGADVLVADMMFATLDTRTRRWTLPDGRVILLSDTVGFLQRLPHHLVASFHATLEETLTADLLLHVVDASHPQAARQMAAVDEVLTGITNAEIPELVVLNKIDRVPDPIVLQHLVEDRDQGVVHVSAVTGEGLDRLSSIVTAMLDERSALVDLYPELADGKLIASVRKLGAVFEQEPTDDGYLRQRVRITEGALGNLLRLAKGALKYEIIEAPRQRFAPPPV